MAKLVQVKGEGRRSDAEPLADLTSRHTVWAGLHQKPKNVEAGVLSERRKSGDGGYLFHNSNMIEIYVLSSRPVIL